MFQASLSRSFQASLSRSVRRSMACSAIDIGATIYGWLSLITFTGLNLINCKTFIILHHPHCCYVYIPGTTCLHILLAHPCLYYYLLSPQYTVLHILFHCTFYSLFFLICILFLPIFIYSLLCYVSFFFFALSIERTCPDLHFTTDYILYN